ncbi:hypothetical protein BC829DRAFT_364198 [Chytridium lagenaria]|nr:hypothetical protein BC829DRAFT_364198 [Chytridium lagenaria]
MATTASSESRKKFVCVGDEACGKTSLLKTFCGTAFSEAYIPTVSESYTTQQTTPIYDDQGGESDHDDHH